MALIALLGVHDRIGAGKTGALLDFGGQRLVEYQARLLCAAGAQTVLLLADSATSELARIVDRVSDECDCEIALLQDMTALARSLMPGDTILLIAGNLVLPAGVLTALLAAGPSAMLSLPAVPATTRFERIDAQTVWAGALCLPGAAVLGTLDMLGEWDLALTLLRRAVQDGAQRVALSPELVMDGHLALLADQASADIALAALTDRRPAVEVDHEVGLMALLAPAVRPLVREVVRRQIEPAQIGMVALLCGVMALALGASRWMIPGLFLMLLALGGTDIASRAARLTLRTSGPRWRAQFVKAGALGLLAWLGVLASGGHVLGLAGAWTPLALIAVMAIIDEHGPPAGLWQGWSRIGIAPPVALMLLGIILGVGDAAFALLGLATIAAVAIRLFASGDSKV